MKKLGARLKKFADFLDAPDNPEEPAYDPVHLGAVLIGVLVAIGALYWLLWTLLVYEGGLFALEGWFGHVAALALVIAAVVTLYRLYRDAARRP